MATFTQSEMRSISWAVKQAAELKGLYSMDAEAYSIYLKKLKAARAAARKVRKLLIEGQPA